MTFRDEPLSPRRARHEARQARRNGYRLPIGHPYRVLPAWVPFGFAKMFARIFR